MAGAPDVPHEVASTQYRTNTGRLPLAANQVYGSFSRIQHPYQSERIAAVIAIYMG